MLCCMAPQEGDEGRPREAKKSLPQMEPLSGLMFEHRLILVRVVVLFGLVTNAPRLMCVSFLSCGPVRKFKVVQYRTLCESGILWFCPSFFAGASWLQS